MAEVLSNFKFSKLSFGLQKYCVLLFKPSKGHFQWKLSFEQEIYVKYDTGHYKVIRNMKAAMFKTYHVTRDTLYDNTHKCDKTCSLCTATPRCFKVLSKYCATCNSWFLIEKCYQNH